MTSDLCLLLRELHVVKDPEDDSKEVVPPVFLECVPVTLHDLKHDGETSVRGKRPDSASAAHFHSSSRKRNNCHYLLTKTLCDCFTYTPVTDKTLKIVVEVNFGL